MSSGLALPYAAPQAGGLLPVREYLLVGLTAAAVTFLLTGLVPRGPAAEVLAHLLERAVQVDTGPLEATVTVLCDSHDAALALLQARGTNLLVLDEPTNHLDLPAIEQLESALASYAGTFVLVSHDRRLLEAVHVTRRLRVEAGHVAEQPV